MYGCRLDEQRGDLCLPSMEMGSTFVGVDIRSRKRVVTGKEMVLATSVCHVYLCMVAEDRVS